MEVLDTPFPWVVIGVLGALIGSFLNVVIARLPAGESLLHPPSHCPKCGDPIPPWLNVPIFAWLILRGRCRACKVAISPRYPLVELLTTVLWLAAWQRFGWSWALLLAVVLASSLVAITFIDLDTWEIADEISLPGIVLGCLLRPVAFDLAWYSGILGAAVGAGFLILVRVVWELGVRGVMRWAKRYRPEALPNLETKLEGMGFGDVKLLGMIGAFLGVGSLLPVILVASFSGVLVGTLLILARKKAATETESVSNTEADSKTEADSNIAPASNIESNENPSSDTEADPEDDWEPADTAFPFGPFLALGALAYLYFEPAYQRLILELGFR